MMISGSKRAKNPLSSLRTNKEKHKSWGIELLNTPNSSRPVSFLQDVDSGQGDVKFRKISCDVSDGLLVYKSE